MPETDETTETESMSGETEEETLEIQPETEPEEVKKERVRVKGVSFPDIWRIGRLSGDS